LKVRLSHRVSCGEEKRGVGGETAQHDPIARPKISLSLIENEATQKFSQETGKETSFLEMRPLEELLKK
jgi:hypothetical protein